jgi:hypothetical protein
MEQYLLPIILLNTFHQRDNLCLRMIFKYIHWLQEMLSGRIRQSSNFDVGQVQCYG